MSTKFYVVGIKNTKDGHVRIVGVVEDLQGSIDSVRAMIHSNPSTAYALFAENYELIYEPFDFGDSHSVIPFTSWKADDNA